MTTEHHQAETSFLVRLDLKSAGNGYPYPETLEQELRALLSLSSSQPICGEPDNQYVVGLTVVAGDRFECEICGDCHVDSLHGEPVFTLDHGRDTPEGNLGDQIAGLDNLINVQDTVLDELQAEYTVDFQKSKLDGDELEIDWSWYDMKMSDVADRHGFVLYNNSDSGTWCIYKAVTSLL